MKLDDLYENDEEELSESEKIRKGLIIDYMGEHLDTAEDIYHDRDDYDDDDDQDEYEELEPEEIEDIIITEEDAEEAQRELEEREKMMIDIIEEEDEEKGFRI